MSLTIVKPFGTVGLDPRLDIYIDAQTAIGHMTLQEFLQVFCIVFFKENILHGGEQIHMDFAVDFSHSGRFE